MDFYRLKIIVLLFLLVIGYTSNAQPWLYQNQQLKSTDSEYSFQEQKKAFNDYWEGREVVRGCGY